MMRGNVRTHDFARSLLARPNEFVRFWLFGRLSIVWDTNRPVLTVATSEILPVPPGTTGEGNGE